MALGDLYSLWGGKVSGQLDNGRIDIHSFGCAYTVCLGDGSPGIWTVGSCHFSAIGGYSLLDKTKEKCRAERAAVVFIRGAATDGI